MKVKTLIEYLEPYKEADIFFGNDELGRIFFSNCTIDTDKTKVLIFPFGKELNYVKTELEKRISIK